MSNFEFFQYGQEAPLDGKRSVSTCDWSSLRSPDRYLPEPAMIDAVNVALALGQPLLVTGEAGTGKTMLAYSIAYQLNLKEPLKFETKSTSEARDLFYTYNSLAHFQAAHAQKDDSRTIDYIDFNALGIAILGAEPTIRTSGDGDTSVVRELRDKHAAYLAPRRSVVLIDEIDKAPRDFPNDILNEIELLSFRIPELGNLQLRASSELRPIVVMTSNSEKNLPDAFLRRCIFYHIPFPTRERLERIVTTRLEAAKMPLASELLRRSLDLFEYLRSPEAGLTKKPTTAELLGWLIALRLRFPEVANPLALPRENIAQTLCSLLKTVEDQKKAPRLLENWISLQNG